MSPCKHKSLHKPLVCSYVLGIKRDETAKISFFSLMAVTLPERALLVKLFYESKGNAAAALREFRPLKNLRKGPLLPQALKRMIARFEKTGHLGVQPGRGRKSTRSDVVEDVATAIVDQSMDNVIGCSSARAVSRHLGVPYSTVWNVLRKVQNSSQSAVDGQ
ncbi:DUF4817 domain-containing protein [Trichonephila clavipes]|nr:DUF4817 domain-containing protein [Trichonephila clavipes]